jgi:peptidase E
MRTKYILHGGESSRRTVDNDRFFKEIVDSTDSKNIKILCVYFARPEHRWQESFYEDKLAFEQQKSEKSLDIQIASREDFKEQIAASNVVFINGGFKGFLKEALEELGNFKELIQNKVIVGISAGANILSKYYYSQGAEDIKEGAGVLPIKVFCHYLDGNVQELIKLERYKENLPVYKIEEEKYVVLEQG